MNAILTRDQIIDALRSDKSEFERYKTMAKEAREKSGRDRITLRAIIEFSNYCKRRCGYCGLNAANKTLQRYRMSVGEIIDAAQAAVKAGYKSIVLQSGEDAGFKTENLLKAVRAIRDMGAVVTLSVGELGEEDYRALYLAGAERYLIKHETANKARYAELHGGQSLEERIACFNALKRIGYAVGGGFMVGLPGADIGDIADDILLLTSLEADMAGIGTFIPARDTPLEKCPEGSVELTLRAVALTGIMLPYANIPCTTSLGVAAGDPYIALDYGADVIMKKATPAKYRRLYAIYTGIDRETDIDSERNEVIKAVTDKGYTIA